MRRRIEKMRDVTGEQVGTPGPKSREDWRKTLYNLPPERYHPGNASGAVQDRISSSRDRDIESDAGMVFTDRRQKLRQQRWLKNRRSGGVTSQSSDGPGHWLQNQGNEVESRPNERKSNTSELGQRKGAGPGESSSQEETSEQLRYARDQIKGDISAREDLLRDENVYGTYREKVEKDLENFKIDLDNINEDLKTPDQKRREESDLRRLRSMR